MIIFILRPDRWGTCVYVWGTDSNTRLPFPVFCTGYNHPAHWIIQRVQGSPAWPTHNIVGIAWGAIISCFNHASWSVVSFLPQVPSHDKWGETWGRSSVLLFPQQYASTAGYVRGQWSCVKEETQAAGSERELAAASSWYYHCKGKAAWMNENMFVVMVEGGVGEPCSDHLSLVASMDTLFRMCNWTRKCRVLPFGIPFG